MAAARGCGTEAQCAAFLEPSPVLPNPLGRYPAYAALLERVRRALDRRERVCLFGDYDADGITSLAQMERFWRAAGYGENGRLHTFVPDRARHDYGLSSAALKECLAECRTRWKAAPALVIALDCGSTAETQIRHLREHSIDTLVIDHHAVEDGDGSAHPAVAHLNPRAWRGDPDELGDLCRMSAAGLTFLVCERLATDLALFLRFPWDREGAALLAGIGTVVDVMPLTGRNRALVKGALQAANQAAEAATARSGSAPGGASSPEEDAARVAPPLDRIPGLRALHAKSGGGLVDVRTLGFQWGPRLNAPGRMGTAAAPLRLLLTQDPGEAEEIAGECDRINRERQEVTLATERDALAEAEAWIARGDGPSRILVLGRETWDPGIVGIVAGRLRERYHRPAIVCGLNRADGCWKGSGRGIDGHDLGADIRAAVDAGLLLRGGGHALAAGLSLEPEKLPALREWLNERCPLEGDDLTPRREVLTEATLPGIAWSPEWAAPAGNAAGAAGARRLADPRLDATMLAMFWLELLAGLEPFGAGNPRPSLLLRGAALRYGPEPKLRRADNSVWALSAGFDFGGQGYLFAEWTDVDRARRVWGTEEGNSGSGARGAGRTPATRRAHTAGDTPRFDLVLAPTRSPKKGSEREAWWYGWRVIDAAPSADVSA